MKISMNAFLLAILTLIFAQSTQAHIGFGVQIGDCGWRRPCYRPVVYADYGWPYYDGPYYGRHSDGVVAASMLGGMAVGAALADKPKTPEQIQAQAALEAERAERAEKLRIERQERADKKRAERQERADKKRAEQEEARKDREAKQEQDRKDREEQRRQEREEREAQREQRKKEREIHKKTKESRAEAAAAA